MFWRLYPLMDVFYFHWLETIKCVTFVVTIHIFWHVFPLSPAVVRYVLIFSEFVVVWAGKWERKDMKETEKRVTTRHVHTPTFMHLYVQEHTDRYVFASCIFMKMQVYIQRHTLIHTPPTAANTVVQPKLQGESEQSGHLNCSVLCGELVRYLRKTVIKTSRGRVLWWSILHVQLDVRT